MSISRISASAGISKEETLKILESENCHTGYREVDGCAGEFPSGSGYYYAAYGVKSDPWEESEGGIAVLGSGAIRIAQGVGVRLLLCQSCRSAPQKRDQGNNDECQP